MPEWSTGSTDEALRQHFGLEPEARVLDVGCGSRPFPLATHLTDASLTRDSDRLGKIADTRLPLYECPAEELPFDDDSFDFLYCAHVLEHVPDPAAACREFIRVARRGYIECPRSWIDYVCPSPDHKWLVDHERDVLIFRERLPEESLDLFEMRFAIIERMEDDAFRERWNDRVVRRVRNVQYHWEGRIHVDVIRAADRYSAGREPEHRL